MMEGLAYLREMNVASVLLRLTLAMLFGGFIGLERERKRRPAGFRTYMMVCLGAALTMLLSQYESYMVTHAWHETAMEIGLRTDVSRFGAQVINGIGFLGAGIIIYRKHEIHGLTTAAGVWATAGVGMAAGAGMYVVAAGAAVVILGVQCIFHIKCRLFRTKKYFQVKICFTGSGTENDTIKELFQTDRFNRLVIERKGGENVYHATLNTDREYSSQKLSQIMTEHPFIRSIERCDED